VSTLILPILAPCCCYSLGNFGNSTFLGRLCRDFFFLGNVVIAITIHKTMIQILRSIPFWLFTKHSLNGGYCLQKSLNYWFPERFSIPLIFPRVYAYISKVSAIYIFILSSMESACRFQLWLTTTTFRQCFPTTC